MRRPETEFSQKTKDNLAKRAGYQCSNPGCGAPTSGADLTSNKSVNLGKAAHIHSAGDGGPRANPKLSDEELADEFNGIWLCARCADLVDKNGGADYPTQTLREWKADRERDSALGVGHRQTTIVDGTHEARGISDVTALDIQGPARLQPGTHSVAVGVSGVTGTRIGPPSSQSPRGPPVSGSRSMSSASVGVKCRDCGLRTGLLAVGGGDSRVCPDCGGPMETDAAASPALANVRCTNCGWSAGIAVGITACPDCNSPL